VADPPFLAETLALGADAAALDGWRPDDIHALHQLLLEGLDTRPLDHAVQGNKRMGFILFEVQRWPTMDNEVVAKLSMKPTTTALDGSPPCSASTSGDLAGLVCVYRCGWPVCRARLGVSRWAWLPPTHPRAVARGLPQPPNGPLPERVSERRTRSSR